MRNLLFELCVESLPAAQVAQAGGADRIELCAELSCGGLTPAAELIAAVCSRISLPVHVLIRPRAGDFVYSAQEFRQMREQIEIARRAGAAGIVTGVLRPDGRVDSARSRALFRQARPLCASFHRAFDETPDLFAALEDVIACGADFLLTSGGATEVARGVAMLSELEKRSAGRIRVMAGGGLKLANIEELMQRSGVTALHASLLRREEGEELRCEHLLDDLREAIARMRQAVR